MKYVELEALGAFAVCGSVDAPGGINLGRLTRDGDVVLTPEGEAWVEANKPAEPVAKATRGKKAAAEAEPDPAES